MSAPFKASNGALDEAYDAHGRPRPLYEDVLAALEGADLGALAGDVDDHLRELGVTFGEVPFRLDPVPRLIDGQEWGAVERGLVQRVRALVAFVADAYGDRRIVPAGVMPARVIDTSEDFEPWMVGVDIRPPAGSPGSTWCAGTTGRCACWRTTYARRRGSPTWPPRAPRWRAPPGDAPGGPTRSRARPSTLLAAALRGAAPEGVDEPAIVLLSDGPSPTAPGTSIARSPGGWTCRWCSRR